jgi:hypothetical protein
MVSAPACKIVTVSLESAYRANERYNIDCSTLQNRPLVPSCCGQTILRATSPRGMIETFANVRNIPQALSQETASGSIVAGVCVSRGTPFSQERHFFHDRLHPQNAFSTARIVHTSCSMNPTLRRVAEVGGAR